MLHCKDADFASAREARNGVGHVNPDTFLANDNRTNIRLCCGFEQVVYRIAEDNLNALAFQNLSDCFADFHAPSLPRDYTLPDAHPEIPRNGQPSKMLHNLRIPGRMSAAEIIHLPLQSPLAMQIGQSEDIQR